MCSDFLDETAPEDFREMVERHGIHAVSVHGFFPCGVRTPQEYDASLEKMKSVMHKALRAGSPRFMPVPQPSDSYRAEEDEQWRADMRKLFSEVIIYGKEIGLQVVENPEHPELLLLRDGKYYDSLEIGGGYLKNKEVIEFLKEKGYHGPVIIEVNCGPNVFDRTLQSAHYLKNII